MDFLPNFARIAQLIQEARDAMPHDMDIALQLLDAARMEAELPAEEFDTLMDEMADSYAAV